MSDIIRWNIEELEIPENSNIIVGQSHFIKTVEDLYEALVTSSPSLKFGIAFCEASGDCLIRWDGNSEEMIRTAIRNAEKLGAGHSFVIVLKDGYPINILDRIKNCQEVCRIFAATANPIQVMICETEQGRGIAGVIDGFIPKGVETEKDQENRINLLKDIIRYKR